MSIKRILLIITLIAGTVPFIYAQDGSSDKTVMDDNKHFGEHVDAKKALSFKKLVKKMKKRDSLEVKVVGTVNSVCQKKGCWMNISSGKPGDKEVFVKFKDYGFFVPKDISGQQVVMKGYAYREVTPVDELRHYAEDEGKSKEEIEAITEPREELKFLASGVLLLDK